MVLSLEEVTRLAVGWRRLRAGLWLRNPTSLPQASELRESRDVRTHSVRRVKLVPIGLAWGERPLLEPGAPTVRGKSEHP